MANSNETTTQVQEQLEMLDINEPEIIQKPQKKSNLTIHALNDDFMDEVRYKLENCILNIKIKDEMIKKQKPKNVKKGIFKNLQGFDYDYALLDAPFVCLKNLTDAQIAYIQKDVLGVKQKSKSWCWFPEMRPQQYYNVSLEKEVDNKYPIYVISKGRYFRNRKYQPPKTIQYLDQIKADYKLVVEEEEYDEYIKSVSPNKVITLPKTYKLNGSSVPVRNFVHHLNIKNKSFAYWILDDNITNYYFTNFQRRYKVNSKVSFRYVEDLFDKFDNVYLAGHQYKMFVIANDPPQVVQQNGRIFSSILIKTDIPTLDEDNNIWRGKYNEDVDLSLRILKMGLPTLLVNTMSADKDRTGGSGGNQVIYIEDNNHSGQAKSHSLLEHHSDCIKIVQRFGRTHHKIDTKQFENNKYSLKDNEEITQDFKFNYY